MLCRKMLSAAHLERCTLDCQFLCFILVFSVPLHGKHSFLFTMIFIGNENIVAQEPGICKQIFHFASKSYTVTADKLFLPLHS